MTVKGIMMALVLTGIAAPANADWQFTKWGMTPDEVIRSSGGTAHAGSGEISEQNTVNGAVGSYVAGNYKFNASYWFENNKLSQIQLSMDGDHPCLNLTRDLLAKYGEPIEFTGGTRRMWIDKPAGNRVTFISLSVGLCFLQYAPLNGSAASGL